MTPKDKWVRIAFACLALVSGRAAADTPVATQIADGVKAVLTQENAKTDGILTVRDDNQFVQCLGSHLLPAWRCEAAGFEGQPWLHHVLTAERQAALEQLGFKPDPKFGNFIASIPKTTTPDTLAALLVRVLADGYAVKPEDIEVKPERLASHRCHRRIKAGHELGGLIQTPTIGLDRDAEKGCGMESNSAAMNYDDPAAIIPAADGIDIDGRYIPAMTAELQRVEGAEKGIESFVIFIAGPAYVQCMHDDDGRSMYCEAVSEDSIGKPIERILTPARKAKLLEAGFAPPGKTMNYSRSYPADQYDMAALSKILLGILKNVYGYQGAPPMDLTTEKQTEHPLVP
jgi:hypothetical protein